MGKSSRVIVLVVGLLSVFAALTGAASATTWTNSGDTAFTATTGAGTLTAGSGGMLTCTSGSATGTATTPQVSATYRVSGTLTYPSCRLLFLTTTVTCTYTLTGSSLTAGVTTGTVTVICTDSVAGCRIAGTVSGRYTNATTTAAGHLDVNGSSGLTSSGCILSGAAFVLPNPKVFTVTNGTGGTHPAFRFGPILNRTP